MRTNIIISDYFADAQCDVSGKPAECLQISLADDSIKNAVMSFAEFRKFLRFRAKQEGQDGKRPASLPARAVS